MIPDFSLTAASCHFRESFSGSSAASSPGEASLLVLGRVVLPIMESLEDPC